jgi:hypothetical protein
METIKTYGFSGPPRHVPAGTKLHLLFGGFLNQFGWIFFGFGLIFVWTFTLEADLTGWLVFRGKLQTAPGVITTSTETNMSVNERPVYRYDYRFSHDGVDYTGRSYQTGGGIKDNRAVTVEFPAESPENSRIQGMRRGMIGLFGLMPVIFPVIGLCFMAGGIRKGVKAIRLLRYGELAGGQLVDKQRTGVEINHQPEYKLTYAFTAADGQSYQAVAKDHQPARLEDEAVEPLLYDSMKPTDAVLLDNLPGWPRVDGMGQIVTQGRALPVLLLLPLATVAGHGVYWWLRLNS